MPDKLKLRMVAVKTETYKRLKAYCFFNDLTIVEVVDKVIAEWLDNNRIPEDLIKEQQEKYGIKK